MRQSPGAPHWLTLLSNQELDKRTAKRIIHEWCIVRGQPIASLFDVPLTSLKQDLSLSDKEAQALVRVAQDVPTQAQLIEQLANDDIGIITRDDIAYPDSLTQRLPERNLPYYIWFRGELSILSHPIISVLGCSEPDLIVQESSTLLAKALAQSGYALVGGYSKGIDRAALQTAEQEGGHIILMLPVGIRQFARFLKPLENALTEGRALVLSPFPPDSESSDSTARARLPLITALAETLVLYEPQSKPDKLWPWSPDDTPGREVLLWSGSSEKKQGEWLETPVTLFEDHSEAIEHIDKLLGYKTDRDADSQAFDSLPGIEPIVFEDTEQAIDLLSQTGNVPDSLRRRLADTDWTNTDIDEEQN